MEIKDYFDLSTTIRDWLARTDLGSEVQTFITLAENLFNYGGEQFPAIRTREMRARVVLPTTNGVATLPSDFLEHIAVNESPSSFGTLDYIDPDAAAQLYRSGAGGVSRNFTLTADSLSTYPFASSSVALTYYRWIPPLNDDNPRNWLLTRCPDLYLRTAMMRGAEYIGNDAEALKQGTMARQLAAGLNRTDMLSRYGRAGLVPRYAVA